MSNNPNSASFDIGFNDNPYFNMGFDNMLTFEANMQELTAVYSDDHTKLRRRDANDQHPISAITNLQSILDSKQGVLTAGLGIIIENDNIRLDDLILNCGTSTTVI